MPFLIWHRRVPATNTGSAQWPSTDAAGIGHVVVEEIDGSAEWPVTDAQGSGTNTPPVPPTPVQPIVIGGPIPRRRRVNGSGHAEHAGPDSSGRGRQLLPGRTGRGSAQQPGPVASGSGRVMPRISGTGAASSSAPEVFGSGVIIAPTRTPKIQPTRSATIADEYEGYIVPVQAQRRRVATSVKSDDEVDELLLMGIL